MVIRRGDIWWADLGEPRGSKAGFRRPVIVIQDDFLNRSGVRTVLAVPLSSNLERSHLSSHVVLASSLTGLERDSVAICTLIEAVNRDDLLHRVGNLPNDGMAALDYGLLVTLGLAS